ncbi:MAG: hypothetical protein ACMG6E_04835 [Candidatus Roizmanbacteria bacterium]
MIAKKSPLAQPSYTTTDNFGLLARGFKTVYTAVFANDLTDEDDYEGPLKVKEIKFGTMDDPDHERTFQIAGMPPPKGTKVWLFGEVIFTVNQDVLCSMCEDIRTFESRELLVDALLHPVNTKMKFRWLNLIYEDAKDNHLTIETYVEHFLKREVSPDSKIFVAEVVLP